MSDPFSVANAPLGTLSYLLGLEPAGGGLYNFRRQALVNLTGFTPIVTQATWAALAVLTGASAGQGGIVYGPDAATHTDPVVGGTVANLGRYTWSTSPVGWKRIGDLDSAEDVRADLGTNPNGLGASPSAFDTIFLLEERLDTEIAILEEKLDPIEIDPPHEEFCIIDSNGNIVARFGEGGFEAKAIYDLQRTTHPPLLTDYQLNLFISYGQSNAIGWNGQPALSTTPSATHLMLSGGTGTLASYPYTAQTLVPLDEIDTATTGESPLSGTFQMIDQLNLSEHKVAPTDHLFQMVGIAAGEGGTAITNLVQGSTDYNKMMEAVDRIVVLAGSANKPIGCMGMGFIQGESDIGAVTPKATYKTALDGFPADLEADIQAKTGQSNLFALLLTQVGSHSFYNTASNADIPLAQYEVSLTNPAVTLVMPTYFLDYNVSDVHFTNQDAKWVGAYLGLAYKRVVLEGELWKPLAPIRKIAQGNVMMVVFDVARPPLVLDSAWVYDPGNYGFQLVNSGGTPKTISQVEIAGHDRVKITCTTAVVGTDKIRYAWAPQTGNYPGRKSGARGCLRDSAGEDLIFDPGGINRPMHNWCVICEF